MTKSFGTGIFGHPLGESRGNLNKLTAKQTRFCEEYLIDLNATKAAERAKFSKKSAGQQAYQLLQKKEIQERITELQQARSKRTEIEADTVLIRLDQIGGVDIAECFTKDGTLKNVHDIPKELRQCIASIEVLEVEEWDPGSKEKIKIGETKKIKFWDKIKANELIGKHKKLWTERVDHTHRVGTLEQLVAGSSEDAKEIEGKDK